MGAVRDVLIIFAVLTPFGFWYRYEVTKAFDDIDRGFLVAAESVERQERRITRIEKSVERLPEIEEQVKEIMRILKAREKKR